MRTLRVAPLALGIVAAATLLAGCSSDGTPVKDPSETVAASSSAPTSSSPSSSPTSSSSAPTSSVEAPADALTMSCQEFLTLDQATQTAVAGEIIAGGRTKIHPNNKGLAATLASAMCTVDGAQTVNEALGGPPA